MGSIPMHFRQIYPIKSITYKILPKHFNLSKKSLLNFQSIPISYRHQKSPFLCYAWTRRRQDLRILHQELQLFNTDFINCRGTKTILQNLNLRFTWLDTHQKWYLYLYQSYNNIHVSVVWSILWYFLRSQVL